MSAPGASATGCLTCLLLGNEPLLTRCGDVALERGHSIAGVVTTSAQVRRWCNERGLRTFDRTEYVEFLQEEPVDLLLSITYPALIPEEAIRSARVAALNYHDGPLPRYAGMNASAWALLRGEPRHAIVWHHLTAGLDAGDIVERRELALEARETSVSLNMKNAVLALESFRALLTRIEQGDATGTPQDSAVTREIFSRHDRPAAMTCVNWHVSAELNERLVRACDFGQYPNRFGLVKLVHRDRAVVVREAALANGDEAPGTVLRADEESLDLACGSGVLRIKRFSSLSGESLSPTQALQALGAAVGARLTDESLGDRELLSRQAAEAEPFFLSLLTSRVPLALPFESAAGGEALRVAVEVPDGLSRRFRVSARDAWIAAFSIVLSSLCREETFDLALVDVASQERFGGARSLIAPAVPLRVTVDGAADIQSLIDAVGHSRRQLARYGGYLRDLVLRHSPLAEQPALRQGELSSAAVVLGDAALPPGATLGLHLDGLEVSLVTNGLVPVGRLRALAREVACVAASIAESPEDRVDSVDLLDASTLFRQVFAWNATLRPFPDSLRIHDLFEAQVTLRPGATALVFQERAMSFQEVEQAANRIANALVARGVGPGDYVGVHLDRGFELVCALLGVAKSGAAYVPLDASYPRERVHFMMEDSGCRVLLCSGANADAFPASLTLPVDGEEVLSASCERPRCNATSTDVCYTIYTSGSTGQPKGVVLTHRAVVNTLDWVNRTLAVTPDDRVLFVTSPSFDLSVYDIFGVLGAGASVEIASTELLAEPARVAQKLCEPGITIWDSAPAALARVAPFFPDVAPRSRLRLVMLSGDWIPLWLPPKLQQTFRSVQVESLGGATEAAIWSNFFHVKHVEPEWKSIPYGRPIQNARYYVLDRRRRPLPAGIPGDLYIAGVCLADGYLNRKELTEDRFVPDPFFPGERMYRTGDLARYWEDGTIEFLGRVDFQVKLRGFRVELGEIEHAIAALSEVREALCTTYLDASGSKSLVAYVVPKPGQRVDEQTVKSSLARSLPEFMLPSHVIVMPEGLPVTHNGKVDRRALPSPTARAASTAYVAPRTDLEHRLVAIWEKLLDRSPIGVMDDFFALGGHSLLAVMMVSELKSAFDIEIPLSRIIEHPTIARLATSFDGESAPSRRSRHLLTLHAEGTRPPLVLVAGVGGYTFTYRNFPKLLGANQPVFTFMAVGAEGEGEPVEHSIEEMAEIYEKELLQASPTGPLVLGGFSFGMLPAFELARRLIERGRDVPLLVSFDGFAPGYPSLLPLRERVAAHVREFIERDGAGRYAYLRDRYARVQRRAYALLGREEELAPVIPFADAELTERMRKLWVLQMRARSRYRPNVRLPCDLLLVKAAIPYKWVATKMDDPHYGWGGFVSGSVSVVTVPGEHTQIFSTESQGIVARAVFDHIERHSGVFRRH